MKVDIILLNYNGYTDTTACIKSLRKITYSDYTIVVVDNNSCDGSYEKLERENPDCVFLQTGYNRGFSAGNNVGIKYALENGADYIMMVNNDTEVAPDFLDIMISKANENTVVTPCIYFYSNPQEVWYAAGRINHRRCTVYNGDKNESAYVDYASGCCLLMPRKVIEQVGMWAEEYFMYYEDMDYSLRILKNGFKILYEKDARVYHKVGRTAGVQSRLAIYYNVRNRLYVIKKFNFSLSCFIFCLLSRALRQLHGILFQTNEKVTIQAIHDYFSGKMGMKEF